MRLQPPVQWSARMLVLGCHVRTICSRTSLVGCVTLNIGPERHIGGSVSVKFVCLDIVWGTCRRDRNAQYPSKTIEFLAGGLHSTAEDCRT